MQLVETLVNGCLLGGLYGLIGLGLSINFGTMRVVHLAHGDLIVLAAYVALMTTDALGLNPTLEALSLQALVILAALATYSVVQRNARLTREDKAMRSAKT